MNKEQMSEETRVYCGTCRRTIAINKYRKHMRRHKRQEEVKNKIITDIRFLARRAS